MSKIGRLNAWNSIEANTQEKIVDSQWNPLDEMPNKELASFFNKVKMPFMMNGFNHSDFRVTINYIGHNLEEWNLAVGHASSAPPHSNLVLARAVVQSEFGKETIVSEIVFEHDTEKIIQSRTRFGLDIGSQSRVIGTMQAIATKLISKYTARSALGIGK